MKTCLVRLFILAITAISALPAFAVTAPANSASPYYTDVANSYVYDQVTEDMLFLNGFLCMMSGMAPNLMVNSGDYIALIDAEACFTSGSGSKSSNKGKQYFPVQVNSSRSSNSQPMITKVWFDLQGAEVPLYSTASQAPSKYLPYGAFRIDGCVKLSGQQTCDGMTGYIDASKYGLSFYYLWKDTNTTGNFAELSLQLGSASSANSGSGIVVTNNKSNNVLTSNAILFAYSPDYFFRNDGTINKCFNRSLNYAQESAWRYGLYDANGEHLAHLTGFPIEYTYNATTNQTGTGTAGTVYNGYISYYGLSMQYAAGATTQVVVPTGETVNQIIYNGTSTPTKKPYTVINSGGKLTKYTTTAKTLSILNKLPIWYWTYANTIPVTGGTLGGRTPAGMQPSTYYEIYWDDTAKNFVVTGESVGGGAMQTLPVSSTVANSAMVTAANGYGLSGWSQLLGGNFTIKGADFALLATTLTPSLTPVITQTQDVVYPQDFAAINAKGGLKCIGDCPTSTTANAFTGTGWGPFAALVNQSYSLNPATGNLLDAAPVSGAPSGLPVVKTSTSAIYSGKLVTGTDATTILGIKATCFSGPCYSQSDVDLLTNPVYYVWQTSSDYWSQMAFLTDQATNTQVTFYPPLPVSFAVPNTSTYGSLAGSTVTLQYGDFGDLWGIPNKCVDLTTNTDCVFAPAIPATPSANQHWAPQFSIPFNTTEGFVTVGQAQGTIAAGDYLVKALDKEIRLAEVPIVVCQALGLTKPVTIAKLPSSSDWLDPRPLLGTKPVLNPVPAPRVIDGVKQY